MKPGRLLVAALLLAIAAGLLWWSNRKQASPPKSTAAATSPKVLGLQQEQIQQVAIEKAGASAIELKRDGERWAVAAPEKLAADQEAASSMLSTLASLGADRVVEENTTNLAQFGLSHPALSVVVTKKDGKTITLLFGDETPTGNGNYAARAGDQRVFIVARYNKNQFDKTISDLRDKRLLTFDSDKLSRIELTAKKQTIEFGRNKDQWQILQPKPLRADQFPVQELIRSLQDAKMDLSAAGDEKKVAAAFNSGTVMAAAKVTDVSGTQELLVRKNKDDYYAKSSAVAGIYKVSSTVGTSLDKDLDNFRNKKLFDFGFSEPEKIEMHDGAKSYSLTRTGSDWWSNGTKMDESSVSPLVSAIRDLGASKFPDSGFTLSVMNVTVTSDSGKRVERVLISKNGERYVAKRENEPALYELAASSVTDLQNSGAAVKAAAPAAPAKK